MKSTLIFLFSFLYLLNAQAQVSQTSEITTAVSAGKHHFQIVGEHSNVFIDSLFANFPKTKRKGYVWRFKNIEIEGLDGSVTLEVHQGLSGDYVPADGTRCQSGYYFHTFTSEKYKSSLLSKRKANEQEAVMIYIKVGRKYGVDKAEADAVMAFLKTIYAS